MGGSDDDGLTDPDARADRRPRARVRPASALIGAGVVLAAGIGLFVLCSQIHVEGEPRVERVMIVPDGQGATVVLYLERRVHGRGSGISSIHVSAYDLDTGARRGDLELLSYDHGSPHHELYRRAGNLAWWETPARTLELIDLTAPRVALTGHDLVAAVPELAGGYHVHQLAAGDYEPPPGAVQVVLRDGRKGWVDSRPGFGTTRPPRPASSPPEGYVCHAGRSACAAPVCYGFAPIDGSVARRLGTLAPPDPDDPGLPRIETGPAPRAAPVADDAAPLFAPELVAGLESGCVFALGGRMLVVHDSAAAAPIDTMLSMIDARGHLVWTKPLAAVLGDGKARILGAADVHGTIVLVGDTERLVVVRVSVAGEVLGRHALQ